jgi:hypothetical protein
MHDDSSNRVAARGHRNTSLAYGRTAPRPLLGAVKRSNYRLACSESAARDRYLCGRPRWRISARTAWSMGGVGPKLGLKTERQWQVSELAPTFFNIFMETAISGPRSLGSHRRAYLAAP